MERQILEAIKIKQSLTKEEDSKNSNNNNYINMNGKVEYNRCILPGLTVKATATDIEENEKDC